LSLRKKLLFGLACCRRVGFLLTDERASRALTLVERFADGQIGPDDLAAAQPKVRAAVEDASFERWRAEADTDFSTHPADSAAAAVEVAVYAVAALFDESASGHAPRTLDFEWAVGRTPHEHAASAARLWAEALSWRAYSPRQGEVRVSRYHRLGATAGRWALWSEEEAQVRLLREVVGPPDRPAVSAWLSEPVVGLTRAIYSKGGWGVLPVLADALEEAGCIDARLLAHCRERLGHIRGCWVIDLLLGRV